MPRPEIIDLSLGKVIKWQRAEMHGPTDIGSHKAAPLQDFVPERRMIEKHDALQHYAPPERDTKAAHTRLLAYQVEGRLRQSVPGSKAGSPTWRMTPFGGLSRLGAPVPVGNQTRTYR